MKDEPFSSSNEIGGYGSFVKLAESLPADVQELAAKEGKRVSAEMTRRIEENGILYRPWDDTAPLDEEIGWNTLDGMILEQSHYPADYGMPQLDGVVYYRVWYKGKSQQDVCKALSINFEKSVQPLKDAGIE